MTSRIKRRFLLAAASVLASVNLASAQGAGSGRLIRQANLSIGQSQSSPTGEAGAAIDLTHGDIRIVQRALIRRGLLHGKADGILGPKTRKAISAFQRQQGLEATGKVDARTVSSLGVSDRLSRQANQSIGQSQSSPAGAQTSATGGEGAAMVDLTHGDIRVVQRALIRRGLLHGKADGVLGPKTRKAISAFQREQGIEVTGKADARTVSSLGVSGRLSQRANQSMSQSQSSPAGAGTSTTGHEQSGTGQANTVQPPAQQNATGQAPNQSAGQANRPPAQQSRPSATSGGQAGAGQANTAQPQPSRQNATGQAPNPSAGQAPKQTAGQANKQPTQQSQPLTTRGQSTAPNQSTTTGQAAPQTQNGNEPSASENAPSGAFSLTITEEAAIGFMLLVLGAFILVPAV